MGVSIASDWVLKRKREREIAANLIFVAICIEYPQLADETQQKVVKSSHIHKVLT